MSTATLPASAHDVRFHAMGTDVHLVVDGDASLLAIGAERIRQLERRWSRFLPTSEISMLNDSGGRMVMVSPDTFDLVAKAVAAWRLTDGLFDPTIGAALIAHGYDRDFADVAGALSPTPAFVPLPPGAGGVMLLPAINGVTLPPGVTIDPGGIGKGLAADLTAQMLTDAGAAGVVVNVGGDLRAIGSPPHADGWVITVPDPVEPDRELLRLAFPGGAMATSSRLQRRWRTERGVAHHLIDPQTGVPARTDVVATTVVAGEAWWAEVLSKALFLAGPSALEQLDGVHAAIVMTDGTCHATPAIEALLR